MILSVNELGCDDHFEMYGQIGKLVGNASEPVDPSFLLEVLFESAQETGKLSKLSAALKNAKLLTPLLLKNGVTKSSDLNIARGILAMNEVAYLVDQLERDQRQPKVIRSIETDIFYVSAALATFAGGIAALIEGQMSNNTNFTIAGGVLLSSATLAIAALAMDRFLERIL